jgi:hypothetical protein
MGNKEPELMVAAEAFTGTLDGDNLAVKRGLELPSDHRIVKAFPKFFVAQALGAEAAATRRQEIEVAMERFRAKQRDDERAARIATGTKILASDDAVAASVKRQVQDNHDLELVYDPNGFAVGARPKRRKTVSVGIDAQGPHLRVSN